MDSLRSILPPLSPNTKTQTTPRRSEAEAWGVGCSACYESLPLKIWPFTHVMELINRALVLFCLLSHIFFECFVVFRPFRHTPK